MIRLIASVVAGATLSVGATTNLHIAGSVKFEPTAIETAEAEQISTENATSEYSEEYEPQTAVAENATPADELAYHDTSYLGAYTITYYCGCDNCGGSVGADGQPLTLAYSVAMADVPLGTTVLIDGVGYRCVTDRGVGSGWVDVYVSSHEEALQLGMHTADVWEVEG